MKHTTETWIEGNMSGSAKTDSFDDSTGLTLVTLMTPTGEPPVPLLTPEMKQWIIVLGVIINTLGILGNGLIVLVIAMSKTLSKPYNGLLASMAVNDMISCGAVNLIQMAGIYLGKFPLTWPSTDVMCRIHNVLWIQINLVSQQHIMVIAGHRYLMVCHQKLSTRITNKITVAFLIISLHVFSFVVLGIPKIFNEMYFNSSVGCCVGYTNQSMFTLSVLSGHLFLAISILLFSYITIYKKIVALKRQITATNQDEGNRRDYVLQTSRLKANKIHSKMVKCMVILLAVVVGGFIPNLVTLTIFSRGVDVPGVILVMSYLIMWTSNATNSLVYSVMDLQFIISLKKLICCERNQIHPIT